MKCFPRDILATGETAIREVVGCILIRDGMQSIPVHGEDSSSESVWCRVIFPDGRKLLSLVPFIDPWFC